MHRVGMLLGHLSDLHLSHPDDPQPGCDALARSRRALSRLAAEPVDALVLTGDLANDARAAEYRLVAEVLDRWDRPVVAVPGNHDDPALFAALFGVTENRATGQLDSTVRLTAWATEPAEFDPAGTGTPGGVTVVLCDSSRPGRTDGQLADAQLAWLDDELSDAHQRGERVVVALHHPPFLLGIPHLDRVGLDATSRAGLAEVVENFPVARVLCGHTHRYACAAFGGTVAVSAPSTAYEFVYERDAQTRIRMGPPGVLVHEVSARGCVTHQLSSDDAPARPYIRKPS